MKISKLFHWLYAILMFLPLLVFIPNAFYYGFNDNAVVSVSVTDDMLTAFSTTMNSSLFSWAYTSFLTEPFQYIGSLFGLPLTSPLYTLMSYWLDISIIWLVFDLVMYVPQLVHRWLDKGIIE